MSSRPVSTAALKLWPTKEGELEQTLKTEAIPYAAPIAEAARIRGPALEHDCGWSVMARRHASFLRVVHVCRGEA